MIKIIQYDQKRRITCKACGALLEFEKGDVKTTRVGNNEYEHQVKCPACDKYIYINKN